MDRRCNERIAASVPFDVYCRGDRLGQFRTRDLSQESLFLETRSGERLGGEILELRFRIDGKVHCLRGIVAHQVEGQGVDIQLAYWRVGDRQAHQAYVHLYKSSRLHIAA